MREVQPRSVRCRDTFGRPGEVTARIRDGEAILTVPPGEAARRGGRQLSDLIDALIEARGEMSRAES